MSVRRLDLTLPYVHSDVGNCMYFGWSVKIARITNFINEELMFLQRILHCTAPTYCLTGQLASLVSPAVLNFYIPFPKEIIVGVGEVLQKNLKKEA